MPELIVVPDAPVVLTGETADLVVTLDDRAGVLTFRDAGDQEVVFTARLPETLSGWVVDDTTPITAAILSSDGATATIQLTAGGASTIQVEITISATGSISGLIEKVVTVDVVENAGGTPLIGDIGGTLAVGTVSRITGDVNLTEDLVVEGTLLSVDTFTLEGNGFQILVQNGGRLILEGVPKSGWVRWGETVSGWNTNDRIGIAPMSENVFLPTEGVWGGSWGATTRPANAADVTMPAPDSRVMKPEVANLTRSILLQNLRRLHFHEGAGVQTLRHLAVRAAGTAEVLGEYPIHFHLNGETTRGSVVEGVVVEEGQNHAFVPHGSHGITFTDCIGFEITNDAYWWDLPLVNSHTANNSNDIVWDHCLAMWVIGTALRRTGVMLGAGSDNHCTDTVVTCLQGGKTAGGFHWPENANNNAGGNIWVFEDNVSHNNKVNGILTWQNDAGLHTIRRFVAYHNGDTQVDHGAYGNHYRYFDVVTKGGNALRMHSQGPQIFEDWVTDGPFLLPRHQSSASSWATLRRVQLTSVIYGETAQAADQFSWIRFEDCGLVPADFDLSGIHPDSLIEIYEDDVLEHSWAGSWG